MYQLFWQAKIWGLLHNPVLKTLYNHSLSEEGPWESLTCMEGWDSYRKSNEEWFQHVDLCREISAASDRTALSKLPNETRLFYDQEGIKIHHLLSGKPLTLKLQNWQEELINQGEQRDAWLQRKQIDLIPEEIKQETDPRKVFWWLWRCYPEQFSNNNEPQLPLLPAESRLPDASVWSNATMTSAIAGSLAGYYYKTEDYKTDQLSRPHIGIFSFSPVQELIKASRKMRDFWAGSWVLHYLSAKVCWKIAYKYGPDTFLYPCLYGQPLIDLFLLNKYPDFSKWLKQPSERRLLTAGFPNVLVTILPNNGRTTGHSPALAVMQQAENTLKGEWLNLGAKVLKFLQDERPWMDNLNEHSWNQWLQNQWQIYNVAFPLGDRNLPLNKSPKSETYDNWIKQQNDFAKPAEGLGVEEEDKFLQGIYEDYRTKLPIIWLLLREFDVIAGILFFHPPNLNIGSWWASLFEQTRSAMGAVKTARNWQIPTVYTPRSSISGIGPVAHPSPKQEEGKNYGNWIKESKVREAWKHHVGLFDGREQLNPSEVLKRGLEKILPLPEVLNINSSRLENYYPDLTSGVAGWLKTQPERQEDYINICQQIKGEFNNWVKKDIYEQPWGIPWIKEKLPHPRLLNAGWLIEEIEIKKYIINNQVETNQEERKEHLQQLRSFLDKKFPNNNPTDWYVLAAGDGDGMGSWLSGKALQSYKKYTPEALEEKINQLPESLKNSLTQFLETQKRMGPSSHNALSRALLDFSNQLLPYLTEERYAGRLIYGGGDDVLAYTNLWEWDNWLWDIRSCFIGAEDPQGEFANHGDYWQRSNQGTKEEKEEQKEQKEQEKLSPRPLFTMGSNATLSFGIVIANQGVPLAIALENLWEAEKEAKGHQDEEKEKEKDAVQVRVIYGSGNQLKATAKFSTFKCWKNLLQTTLDLDLEGSIFEQAATVWGQHPAPVPKAIEPWTLVFCSRREQLKEASTKLFQTALAEFLTHLWQTTSKENLDREVNNWLKLAAFIKRNREIKIANG